MTKKYSSFKDQQKITENFRKFISEIRVGDQTGTSPNRLTRTNRKEVLDTIKDTLGRTIEQHAEIIVDFTGLTDSQIWDKLIRVLDRETRSIISYINPHEKDPGMISSDIQNWVNDRGLTDDGEIDLRPFNKA